MTDYEKLLKDSPNMQHHEVTKKEKFLELVRNAKPSNWKKDFEWRQENGYWLDPAFKIAVRILIALREQNMTKEELADRTNISLDDINLILKGQYNLDLKMIGIIENVLNVELI